MGNTEDKINEVSKYLDIFTKCDALIDIIGRLNIDDIEKTKLKNKIYAFRSELSKHGCDLL